MQAGGDELTEVHQVRTSLGGNHYGRSLMLSKVQRIVLGVGAWAHVGAFNLRLNAGASFGEPKLCTNTPMLRMSGVRKASNVV